MDTDRRRLSAGIALKEAALTASAAALELEEAGLRRARLAWTVLLSAFAIFCLLTVGGYAGLQTIVTQATREAPAEVEVVGGTVLVHRAGSDQPVGVVQNPFELHTGDQVRTDGSSRALVGLVDGSYVELRQETALTVLASRHTRFNDRFSEISLRLDSGRARVAVGLPTTQARHFRLSAAGALLDLDEGSYVVDMGRQGVEVAVRNGRGTVAAASTTFTLQSGHRSWIAPGQPPQTPVLSGKDLLVNGDFREGGNGLHGWRAGHSGDQASAAEISTVSNEGRRALRLARAASNRSGESFVVQSVDADVSDFQWLEFSFDGRLFRQGTPAANARASENPLSVRLKYRDATGREHTWSREFYYRTELGSVIAPTAEWRPRETWFHVSKSLLDQDVAPRPVHIYEIILATSGQDVEAWVDNVRLVGQ